MSDQGFQAFKGESNELVMEERPQRGAGRRGCHKPAHAELPFSMPVEKLQRAA